MFKGLMLYLQLYRRTLEIDEANFSDGYEILKQVVDKFIIGKKKTSAAEIYVITTGSAYYFENKEYAENVILPNIQNFRYAQKLLSPFIEHITHALPREEKWIVFGPIKEEFFYLPRLFHLVQTNRRVKKLIEKQSAKFIKSAVTGVFLEFRITASPAYLEEIDIYKYPESCAGILERILYEDKPLSVGPVLFSKNRFYLLDESDISMIFEAAESMYVDDNLILKAEELRKEELKKAKTSVEFVDYLLEKECSFF